jgi:hypothetical protein
MPFVVNGLKVCDNAHIKPSRAGIGVAAAFAIGLAVAVPVVFWANQNYSARRADKFASQTAPRFPYDTTARAVTRLEALSQRDAAERISGWQRIRHLRPERHFLWAAGVGLALVIAFSAMRLRFAWWPLHPVMFVVWDTYALWHFSWSFLLGWFIKRMVMRFGGAPLHRRLKPLAFGVIAGELLGGLVFMAVGAGYYAVTGMKPPEYKVFPG